MNVKVMLALHAVAGLAVVALDVQAAEAGQRSYGCVGTRPNGDKITINTDTLVVTPAELTEANMSKLSKKGFAGSQSIATYRGGSFEDAFKQGATFQPLALATDPQSVKDGKLSLTPKSIKVVSKFTDDKQCKKPPKEGKGSWTEGSTYKITFELNWQAGNPNAPKTALEQVKLTCFENKVDGCP
jgi:hypothetical protein